MSEMETERFEEEVISLRAEDLFRYIGILINSRKSIVIIFLSVILVTLVYLLTTPPFFIATTTILPSESTGKSSVGSNLVNLPDELGLSLAAGQDFSALYEAVLKSRRTITSVLKSKFNSENSLEQLPLFDILKIEGGSLAEKLDTGYKMFVEKIMTISIDKKSNIIAIEIETKEANLSADVASAMIKELDRFMRAKNIERASESRIFIEERLQETKSLLSIAEEYLKNFRENNKRIENSPQLKLEEGRLIREVRVQEEVYLTLKKEFEIIKIEEVRSFPIITVLDEAIPPVFRSKPKRTRTMIISTFFALFFGIVVAFGLEHRKNFLSSEGNNSMIRKVFKPLKEDYNNLKSFVIKHRMASK